MSDAMHPPQNCQWWSPGDWTRNPPEDKAFLSRLAAGGFRTFVAEGGLCGALVGNRAVDVIHRGFGRRWEIGFIHDDEQVYSEIVISLPSHADAAVSWLSDEPIDRVKEILQQASNELARKVNEERDESSCR